MNIKNDIYCVICLFGRAFETARLIISTSKKVHTYIQKRLFILPSQLGVCIGVQNPTPTLTPTGSESESESKN